MRRIKYLIFFFAILLQVYLQVEIMPDTEFINIYYGACFNADTYTYIRFFFLFAIYSFYICGEFSTYLKKYGALLVTRENKRNKLFMRLTKRMISLSVQIELMKLFCYVVLLIFIRGRVTIGNPLEVVNAVILNIIAFLFVLFMQMLLELYISENVSIVISITFFIICLRIGDYIKNSKIIPDEAILLLIPNLMMKSRTDILVNTQQSSIGIISMIIILFAIVYFIFEQKFKKFDII